jgi:hypothetical protein
VKIAEFGRHTGADVIGWKGQWVIGSQGAFILQRCASNMSTAQLFKDRNFIAVIGDEVYPTGLS